MNEVIKIDIVENQLVTDSKRVAEVFGKQHGHVLRDIDMLKDCSNFGEMFKEAMSTDVYGRPQRIYYMNRDGFSLLAMGFTGKESLQWKIKYINAFNEMEKAWNSPEQVYARALKMADQAIERLKTQNFALSEDINRMKPKEIFADAVAASNTSILIGDLAKLIRQNGVEIGQKRLFIWLRDKGYLIKRSGSDWNMPTQKSMEMGLFEVKESTTHNPDGSIRINRTTKVTGKGQQYFINKFFNGSSIEKH